MNPTKDDQPRLTAFAEAIRAEETARSADVEAALDTLTREAREQDGSATRADIERLVVDADVKVTRRADRKLTRGLGAAAKGWAP